MHIGSLVKNMRKRKGYTQKELANKSDLAEITIRKIEKEELNPKIDTIKKIALALEIPFTSFLSFQEQETLDLETTPIFELSHRYSLELKERGVFDILHTLYGLGIELREEFNEDSSDHKYVLVSKDFCISITDEELKTLEKESNNYLKFKVMELVKSKQEKQ